MQNYTRHARGRDFINEDSFCVFKVIGGDYHNLLIASGIFA